MISNCPLYKQKWCGVPQGSILGSLLLNIFLLILAQIIQDSYFTTIMQMAHRFIPIHFLQRSLGRLLGRGLRGILQVIDGTSVNSIEVTKSTVPAVFTLDKITNLDLHSWVIQCTNHSEKEDSPPVIMENSVSVKQLDMLLVEPINRTMYYGAKNKVNNNILKWLWYQASTE